MQKLIVISLEQLHTVISQAVKEEVERQKLAEKSVAPTKNLDNDFQTGKELPWLLIRAVHLATTIANHFF